MSEILHQFPVQVWPVVLTFSMLKHIFLSNLIYGNILGTLTFSFTPK